MYRTDQLPQADNFELVIRTIEAVSHGLTTDDELADEYGNYDERQGRYYRKAAELLGLVELRSPNQAVLTAEGQRYILMNDAHKRIYLAEKIVSLDIFREIIDLLQGNNNGVTRRKIHQLLETLVDTTEGMIKRRT